MIAMNARIARIEKMQVFWKELDGPM